MQLVGMVVSDYPSNPWDCIFTYIHHNQPKVGKQTNPMDPVDYSIFGLFNKIISLSLSFSFFCIPFFSGFLGYSLPKKHQSYTTRPPISLTLKNPEYQRMQTKHYKQHQKRTKQHKSFEPNNSIFGSNTHSIHFVYLHLTNKKSTVHIGRYASPYSGWSWDMSI